MEFRRQFLAGLLELLDLLLQVGDLFFSNLLVFWQHAELVENFVVSLGSFLLSRWLSALEILQRFEKSGLCLISLEGLLLVFFDITKIADACALSEFSQDVTFGNLIDLLLVLGEVEGCFSRV